MGHISPAVMDLVKGVDGVYRELAELTKTDVVGKSIELIKDALASKHGFDRQRFLDEVAKGVGTGDLHKAWGDTIDALSAGRGDADMRKSYDGAVGELQKSWTQSATATSGITEYDLEAPAKELYPVITPLRNMIPRVPVKGGIQANWRAVTGINTGNKTFGITEGNRSPVIVTATHDYTAAYKSYGSDDSVTFEAQYAAEGFDDMLALAMRGLLRAEMIEEEKIIIGANTSLALGTTPTPTSSTAATGGSLADQTWSIICVALTYEGYLKSSVANGLSLQTTRTLADGSTENDYPGTAIQSTAKSQTTTGGGLSTITAAVAAVTGAFAYAWFLGTSGSEKLNAITTTAQATMTAASAGGAQAASGHFSTDYSQNPMIFDGLFSQILTSGSGSYVSSFANGATLTADGAGGVVEIDAALQSFWDNYRLAPDAIWVSSQEQRNITKKVLAGSSTAAQRFVINVEQGNIKGGDLVTSYLNKFTMDGAVAIPIRLHPNVPAGTIMLTCSKIPYPLSNVTNVLQMRMRRDFYATKWPFRTRKHEYGIYASGVLQCYFPPAFGLITNVANG